MNKTCQSWEVSAAAICWWGKVLTHYGVSSRKWPPCISDHLGLTFWMSSYRRFDCMILSQNIFLCVILSLFLTWQKGEPLVAHRPQLRIVTPRGLSEPEEISADALSVRGFEQYRCDDYHLGRTMLITWWRDGWIYRQRVWELSLNIICICYGLNLLPVQIFLNWFIFFKLVHIFQTSLYFLNWFIFIKLVHIFQTGSYFSNWVEIFKPV